jgi:nitrate/nitrite transporter NarK
MDLIDAIGPRFWFVCFVGAAVFALFWITMAHRWERLYFETRDRLDDAIARGRAGQGRIGQ